jgi:hypothetical protein
MQFGATRPVVGQPQRDDATRVAWWTETLSVPVEALAFIAETGANTAMLARYARSPRGTRANNAAPRNQGPSLTMLSRLRFLPASSPDFFNPIEWAFSKLKGEPRELLAHN